MQFTSPSRRALGVLAVSTVGFTSAVLGVAGVAQAAVPTWETTSPSGAQPAIPAGICYVDWTVSGGAAGADSDGNAGYDPGYVEIRLPAEEGDVYTLNPGGAGGDAADATTPGTGGVSADSDPAADGDPGVTADDDSLSGGGGGAASTVRLGSTLVVSAFGADAEQGYEVGGLGGGGGENYALETDGALVDPWASAPNAGVGEISGEGVACRPSGPNLSYVEELDGALELTFSTMDDGDLPTDHFEYSTNGTTWATLSGVTEQDGLLYATISGLTNKTEYDITIQAVAANGAASPPSETMSGTPHKKATAPANVKVVTGEGTMTVSWDASTPGSWPIAGYGVALVWTNEGGQSGGGAPFCETGPTVFTCTAPAQPGVKHDIAVVAFDTTDRLGEPALVTSDVVAPSSTVPESDGELTLPAGKSSTVMPGEKVTIKGSGYAPFSTVTVMIYSTPQVLTTVVTDGNGDFEVTVTVPPGLAPGKHTLVASGFDGLGNLRNVTLEVTVANGLAYTGTDVTLPAIGGVAALTVGTGLLVLSRRRKPAATPVAV